MAVSDTGSVAAGTAESTLRGRREPLVVEETLVDAPVPGKWHPGATLAFIVISCVVLWSGIFAGLALLF